MEKNCQVQGEKNMDFVVFVSKVRTIVTKS